MIEEFLEQFGWIMGIGLLIIGALVLQVAVQMLCVSLDRRWARRKSPRRVPLATLPASLMAPLMTLIWVLAVVFVLEILFRQWLDFDHSLPLTRARQFTVIGCVTWWLLRWNNKIQKRLQHHATNGHVACQIAHIDIVGKVVALLVLFFSSLLILQIAGVNLAAVVTLGGFGAVAIGLAGKDIFSNFFSGLMLYVTRPFGVGDRISAVGKEMEGTVEQIGWYLTQLRTIDKQSIYVPNSIFSTAAVVNVTRMTNRRIEFKLGLRYCDLEVVEQVVSDLRLMLGGLSSIDQELTPVAWFTGFETSSLSVFIRAYTKSVDWFAFLEVQQQVLLLAGDIIKQHGAEVAFPTTTLDIPPMYAQQED